MRRLHITNGESVVCNLRNAAIEGDTLGWPDLLFEGPVVAGLADEETLAARARHLFASGYVSPEAAGRLDAFAATLKQAGRYDEVVLWFEHDVHDQLILAGVLEWLGRSPRPLPAVRLICIDAFAGVSPFYGLGQLDAAQMASLLPRQEAVGEEQIAAASRAWRALVGTRPEVWRRMAAYGELTVLPFLGPALLRLAEEFPQAGNGLSRTQAFVLHELERRGAVAIGTLFRAHMESEARFYPGDRWFLRQLTVMAGEPHALIGFEQRGDQRVVAIREAGRSIRAGEDVVRLRGIDRWIGGCHLQAAPGSGDAIWRWDRGELLEK